jgi:hypothetical protein
MFITNHVLAGAIAGSLYRDRPVRAFALGVATHVVMDVTPHWGNATLDRDGFFAVAKRDGVLGAIAVATVTAAGVPPRTALVAGMVGAALLDADKPCEFFFGVNPWPGWLDRFHKGIQHERPEWIRNEVVAGVALGALTVGLLSRARARVRTR